MAAKKEKKPLIPPDLERCQAEKPNGHSFMTLGGRPGMERCTSKPLVIVTESKPGDDGRKGSMALCGECLEQLLKQMPKGFVTVNDITEDFPPMWRKIACDLCDRTASYRHPDGGLRCDKCPRPDR